MDIGLNIAVLLGVVSNLVAFAYGYGRLTQSVNDLGMRMSHVEMRMSRVESSLDSVRERLSRLEGSVDAIRPMPGAAASSA